MSAEDPGEHFEPPEADPSGGVANVLLLASSMDDDARQSYFRTFLPSDPSAYTVLALEYRRSPSDWVDEWDRYVGERPRRCTIISVNDVTRSAAASSGASAPNSNGVVTVENPGDLTGVGIAISENLPENGRTLVTFDSLTVLLQYVDRKQAFRFLHALTSRMDAVDALAHYHMDPDAHDEQTVATLASLFDTVAEFDDGEWSIRRR